MRPVVITGATSFLGIELGAALAAEGRPVHALVRPTSDTHRLEAATNDVAIVRAEPTVPGLSDALSTVGDATVVHLAATYVRSHGVNDVDRLLDANVGFGVRLVEAMTANGLRRLVNTGTFFQHLDTAGYRPVNLYAATKQAFETILDFHVDSGLIDALTLVLFDVYGERDWRRKFLDVVVATQHPDGPDRIGLPATDAVIDLVHVNDVVAAYRRAIELLETGAPTCTDRFAVSSGRPHRLSEVIAIASDVGGRTVECDHGHYPDPGRTPTRPWAGPQLPGWAPQIDLETGIRRLLDSAGR